MSADPSTSTSHSNFASIFNAALEKYNRRTKQDLAKHPLLPRLQSCDSPEAILTVLREQIPAFNQSQRGDDRLTKWVSPTVNVLYAFSSTIGQGVGKMQDVRGDVRDIRDDVQGIDNKVQDVDDRVQGVDDKFDQANRSLFL